MIQGNWKYIIDLPRHLAVIMGNISQEDINMKPRPEARALGDQSQNSSDQVVNQMIDKRAYSPFTHQQPGN